MYLFMAVKLADLEDLERTMIDADNWYKLTPSQKQLLRIKKGLWTMGSGYADGIER